MKVFLCVMAAFALAVPLFAAPGPLVIPSPTHEQTFAYGSERHRQWMTRGPDHHLALSLEFTNDPYVDRVDPRRYDDFIFDFPAVRLGKDGRTFYYHPQHGPPVAVAERHKRFLGLEEVRLLAGSRLFIHSPHGYLSLAILVSDQRSTATASL